MSKEIKKATTNMGEIENSIPIMSGAVEAAYAKNRKKQRIEYSYSFSISSETSSNFSLLNTLDFKEVTSHLKSVSTVKLTDQNGNTSNNDASKDLETTLRELQVLIATDGLKRLYISGKSHNDTDITLEIKVSKETYGWDGIKHIKMRSKKMIKGFDGDILVPATTLTPIVFTVPIINI